MSSRFLDRRNFLKLGSLGMAAAARPGRNAQALAAETGTTGVVSRTLGRTGLEVAVVGIGTLRTSEPSVIKAAFDSGVNWLDTARSYMRGRNERICGEALKGYRDKVYVTTKTKARSKDKILREAEESLRSLQTDHVDLYLVHQVESKSEAMSEPVKEAFAQLRKEGKIRFVGVSTHENQPEVLDAVIQDPDKFFDAVLVGYNYRSPANVKEAVARAAKAGIGIIAMKTQAGGYKTEELGDISPHQAALKWVLQDTNVTVAVPGMVTLDHVRENTEVMRMMKLTRVDRQILRRYAQAIAPYHCIGCEECSGTCPNAVRIADVNRCLMYAEGYGDLDLARTTYAELPSERTAAACKDCATCVATCTNGVQIAERMRTAQTVFA